MKNVVSVKDNELLDNLTYSGVVPNVPMKTAITDNTLEDYSDGIKFCDLKVFPSDLYWYWGNDQQIKNWANGDILDIGDIIVILDKNGESILYYDEEKTRPYYFRVIDIKTIYEGQVLLELKLQECKLVGEI